MVRSFFDRRKQAADDLRHSLDALVLFAAQRSFRPRTVVVSEYELRPLARYGWGRPPHNGLLEMFRSREAESQAMIEALGRSTTDLFSIPGGRDPSGGLTWDNDWWGGLDAMVLYTSLRDRKPRHYVEIGSGYSTRFARRAISDHELGTRITSIDPQPRADIDDLCDQVLRCSLEASDLSVFSTLGAGDVLVMDGSHMALMNSDAVVFFLDVLPNLAPGVLVAIDDVFLPWDYPPEWVDRWYGEQYLLASMLLYGADDWRIRFPAWFLTQDSEEKQQFGSLWEYIRPSRGEFAMSFWMEKTE
jgi:hypothetical protein